MTAEQDSKTTSLREAVQSLVDALQSCADNEENPMETREALAAGRAALALPDEPVAYDQTALELCSVCGWKTLIPGDGCLNCERKAAPVERQPLTDEQIEDMRGDANRGFNIEREDYFKAVRDAEAAHGIKGAA